MGARHHQATGPCTPGAFSGSCGVAPPSLKAEIKCGAPELPHRLFPQGCDPPAPSLDHSHACTSPRSSRLQNLSTEGLLLTREEDLCARIGCTTRSVIPTTAKKGLF